MFHIFLTTLVEALKVTSLVIVMMALIECLNIASKGHLFNGLKKWKFGQIVVSAILGALPGCMGGFASVSLYTHRMLSFGALTAMMIATTGDESFMMIAMFPKKAGMMFLLLFALAIIVGIIIDYVIPFKHGEEELLNDKANEDDNYEIHPCDCVRSRNRFVHFLKEHLWEHIVRKHLPKIFGWTFSIMLIFALLDHYIDLNTWISGNVGIMILIAILIGLIPQSGPHIIFVTLFASGVISFPVLLANSLVQEGHAGLPLLAESKKSFFYAKLIKCGLALTICYPLTLI